MSKGFYIKLAWSNIQKNHQTYLPYLWTSILTVVVFYNVLAIAGNRDLEELPGGVVIPEIMGIGFYVVAIFSVVFLFYTNSFLMKQRKKELGLYCVLCMGKRHLRRMMAAESLMMSVLSIAGGFLFGILLNRLAFLLMAKLTHITIRIQFRVSIQVVQITLLFFVAVFGSIFLFNQIQISLTNPIDLLKGGNKGEKEPKMKWFLALVGFGCIGCGYYMAWSVQSPMSAIPTFFAAVLAVVIGTYGLFVAGSILILKLLRKNKKFYYHPTHFTAVSNMIYRMKQNAVSLANICILSTMVLVMLSSTVALNAGMGDFMDLRMPQDIIVTLYRGDEASFADVQEEIQKIASEQDITQIDVMKLHTVRQAFAETKSGAFYSNLDGERNDLTGIRRIQFLPLTLYNHIEGTSVTLGRDEVLVYEADGVLRKQTEFVIDDQTFRAVSGKKQAEVCHIVQGRDLAEDLVVVVPDLARIKRDFANENAVELYEYKCNLPESQEQRKAFEKELLKLKEQYRKENQTGELIVEGIENLTLDLYSVYGGLLFLGIVLGGLFLMAAVLIIYYKQISEGYEDRERYQIMKKVGMSKGEIRKTIFGQVRMVFFLPLVVAVIHMLAACPVLVLMMDLMGFVKHEVFYVCMGGTVFVFAVVYVIVYKATAREYEKIISV